MKKLFAVALTLAFIIFAAYESLIYIDNNFRLGRMWETPAVSPHEKEILNMEEVDPIDHEWLDAPLADNKDWEW